MSYIEGESRNQALLFPEILDDCIPQDNLIRFLDAFVEGRPPYDPRDLLKLYPYGYLNGGAFQPQTGARVREERRVDVVTEETEA